jgi:cell division transport system permease protein
MADRRAHRRRPGRDDFGLELSVSARLLPLLLAAMGFLASLALEGCLAAGSFARHWQDGAQSELTVQVPQPDQPAASPAQGSRQGAVLAALQGTGGIGAARALSGDELAELMRPWLGDMPGHSGMQLPGIVAVLVAGNGLDVPTLAARLTQIAPGTLVDRNAAWADPVATVARALQVCAGAAVLVVACVAVALMVVAIRFGLAARRQAIEIVHGMGATDVLIASQFAARVMKLAASGAGAGAAASLPVLVGLSLLAAPFAGAIGAPGPLDWLAVLPPLGWVALPALPLAAASIGWVTAQITVRLWLRRLP